MWSDSKFELLVQDHNLHLRFQNIYFWFQSRIHCAGFSGSVKNHKRQFWKNSFKDGILTSPWFGHTKGLKPGNCRGKTFITHIWTPPSNSLRPVSATHSLELCFCYSIIYHEHSPYLERGTGGNFDVTQPSLCRPSTRWGHSKILVEVKKSKSDATDDQIVEVTGLSWSHVFSWIAERFDQQIR